MLTKLRWLQRDINKSNLIFCNFDFEFEFEFDFAFEFEFDFAFEFEFELGFEFDFAFELEFEFEFELELELEFDFAFEFEFGYRFVQTYWGLIIHRLKMAESVSGTAAEESKSSESTEVRARSSTFLTLLLIETPSKIIINT